ncbi:MAG: hypothetical protein KBT57_01045 [bacterium]|nr:hypothetical protein [Candidatus Limimorpha equi]
MLKCVFPIIRIAAVAALVLMVFCKCDNDSGGNPKPERCETEMKPSEKIKINSSGTLYFCLTWENVKDEGRLFYEKYEVIDQNLKQSASFIIDYVLEYSIEEEYYKKAYLKAYGVKGNEARLDALQEYVRLPQTHVSTLSELYSYLTWENVQEGPILFFEKHKMNLELESWAIDIINYALGYRIGEEDYERAYEKASKIKDEQERFEFLKEYLFEIYIDSKISTSSKLFSCLTWENVKGGYRLFGDKYMIMNWGLSERAEHIIRLALCVGEEEYNRAYDSANKVEKEEDRLSALEENLHLCDVD